jgi:hypothetical protein
MNWEGCGKNWGRMWKEVVVASFEVLFQYFLRGAE